MKIDNPTKTTNPVLETDVTEIRELTVAELESIGGGNHVTLNIGPVNQ